MFGFTISYNPGYSFSRGFNLSIAIYKMLFSTKFTIVLFLIFTLISEGKCQDKNIVIDTLKVQLVVYSFSNSDIVHVKKNTIIIKKILKSYIFYYNESLQPIDIILYKEENKEIIVN
jgi:hypothetical protein